MSTPLDTVIREQGGLPPQQTVEEFEASRKEMMQDIETLLQNNLIKDASELTYNRIMEKFSIATMRDTKEIYAYNGNGVYEKNGESIIHEQITGMYGKHYEINTFLKIKSRIQGETYATLDDFNKDINLIPVNNGLVNIQTKELLPFNPKIKFTFKLPVEYNPESKCPKIDKFISEVFQKEDIPIAYEIPAYCIYRDYPVHKAFMLLGSGRNGKTTYLNLITNFLGMINISAKPLQQLCEDKFSLTTLYGKLANICDDLPKTMLKETGFFKIITGDGIINYEKKHKDSDTPFKNHAKLIFAANELPASKDTTLAFFERWVILNFQNVFLGDNATSNLIDQLITPDELSGLLNKCLDVIGEMKGYWRLSEGSTKNVREEYIRLSDPILGFFNDVVVRDINSVPLSKEDVYRSYVEYCEGLGSDALSDIAFGRVFKSKASWIGDTHSKVGGKNVRLWRGFNLRTDSTDKANLLGCNAREEGINFENNVLSVRQESQNLYNNILQSLSNTEFMDYDILVELFKPNLGDFEVVFRKLEEQGFVYEPKKGYYLLTEKGEVRKNETKVGG